MEITGQADQILMNESFFNRIKDKKVLFIIPAYNEEGNISQTIREIKSLGIVATILVVNDGSVDQTGQYARQEAVSVIDLPFNLGIGGAVQTGFKFARQFDYDIAIQVDGDTQHDPSYVVSLLEPLLDNEADMAIGSRFLPPYTGYRSSFVRRIGIHFFAALISLLTSTRTTDPTSGFRAFNKKLINVFSLYYPHDFPEPEAIVVAGRYNARVKEVPVKMRKRLSGSSSIRYLKTFYYMLKVTVAILLDKLKAKKDINRA